MADAEVSDNSQRLHAVFDEDVVQSKDKKKIGIVVKTTRDDDSDEDSDSSEFEEDKVEEGQIMVAWYKTNNRWNDDDEVKVVNEDTVNLVDRSLLHGDIIKWVDKSKGTQKGQIKEVIVACDLKIVGTNHVLRNVNAKKLLPLQNFVPYIPVVKGAWLGYIQEVWMELTVRLKNNSRCIISGTAVNSLHDVTDQRDEESTYYCTEFYRGQQVRGPASVFKDAKWIVGLRPAVNNQRSIKAIVEEIRVEKIRVDWQVCGFTGDPNGSLVQPDAIIPSAQLSEVITLNHFKEASITIGDKALYTLTEQDQEKFKLTKGVKASASEPVDKEADKEEASKQDADESSDDSDDNEAEPPPVRTSHLLRGGRRTVSRPRRPPCRNTTAAKRKKRYKPTVSLFAEEKVCVEVVLTKTMANVVWQRGDLQENIPSTDLYPVLHLDELEFFPGDFVNDKREDQKNRDHFGVVQTADFNNRTCSIRWLQFVNDVYESAGHTEEHVSVYDVADHKDYSFRAGDVVVRLATANEPEVNNEGISVPPAGEVVKVDLDGLVTVLWSDESTSSILPSRLYVLDKEDDGDIDFDADMNSDDDDGSDNSGEWETASDRSDEGIPFIETEEGIPNIESEERVPNIDSGDVIPFIEGMLGAEGQMDPLEDVIMRSLAALNSGNRNTPSSNEHVIGRDRRTEDFINALDSMFDREAESGNNEEAEEAANTENESKAKGRLFTTEHAPNTHHFINTVSAPHNLRAFHGAVSRDIKLLKAHLPLGIFVKCFEDRMDLLSLLVVGPSGTPYEDGLFYFDLQLPDGYPAVPPKVFYYSYCSARLNPNLYEEGKVCVSLLGTWSGKGSETWTTKSTLHQLFVSIQGLILNEEPYFNEAGFEKQKGTEEGIESSRMYNEMATIKMLQTMLKMISRPPEIFSEEVTSHFKTTIPRVVKRMKSWLDSEHMDNKTESCIQPLFPLLPLSKGFRDTVTRLLEKLEKVTFPTENE